MGSSQSKNLSFMLDEFQILEQDPKNGIYKLNQKRTDEIFLYRQICCSNQKQILEIQRLIDVKLSLQSPYVSKLQKSIFKASKQYCTSLKLFYVLFKYPLQTLKQESLNRKFKKQQFSEEQLELILEVGIKALLFLKNINHPHKAISSSSIFITEGRNIIVGDPWMFYNDNNCNMSSNSTKNACIYPSPQILQFQKQEIDHYDYHLSDLFTFGIVLLQIFFMNHMDILYEKNFQRVNFDAINKKINMLTSQPLRKKLFTILEYQPKNRGLIYKQYLKKAQSQQYFTQKVKQKFRKNIEKYNLATSQVTQWKATDRVPSSDTFTTGIRQNKYLPILNRPISNETSFINNNNPQYKKYDNVSSYISNIPSNSMLNPINRQNQFALKNKNPMQTSKSAFRNYQIQSFNKRSVPTNYYLQNNNYALKLTPNYSQSILQNLHQQNIKNFHFQNQLKSNSSFHFTKQKEQLRSNNINSPIFSKLNQQNPYLIKPVQYSTSQNNISQQFYRRQQPIFIQKQKKQVSRNNFSLNLGQTNYNNNMEANSYIKQNQNNQIRYQSNANESIVPKISLKNIKPTHQSYENSPLKEIVQSSSQKNINPPSNKMNFENIEFYQTSEPRQSQQDSNNKNFNSSAITERMDDIITNKRSNSVASQKTPVRLRNQPQIHFLSTINERSQKTDSIKSQKQSTKIYTITYQSGTRYEGQMKQDKRNGKGVFYYVDGSRYDGDWKDNKMHGKGTLYYPNNSIAYEGDWLFDNFHGFGFVYNDQPLPLTTMYNYRKAFDVDDYWSSYKGQLYQDQRQGNGILKLVNGQYFEGQFKNDKLNGFSKFYRLNGQVVQGEWKDNLMVQQTS